MSESNEDIEKVEARIAKFYTAVTSISKAAVLTLPRIRSKPF